ncbi:MAG: peroxidase [bacterium]|nr:peroxidase [bacterium]
MAWIRQLEKSEAEGELARLYERIAPGDRPLDNILAIHSLHPRSLSDHFELYRTLMYGSGPLSRREREVVAVAVSAANACRY